MNAHGIRAQDCDTHSNLQGKLERDPHEPAVNRDATLEPSALRARCMLLTVLDRSGLLEQV
jgi:hypothetical protein